MMIAEDWENWTADFGRNLSNKLMAAGIDTAQCPQKAHPIELDFDLELSQLPGIYAIVDFDQVNFYTVNKKTK